MKKTAIIIMVLMLMTACSLHKVVEVAIEILQFIDAVDDKVLDLYNKGILPQDIYQQYVILRDRAEVQWQYYKDQFIQEITELFEMYWKETIENKAYAADKPLSTMGSAIMNKAIMAKFSRYITETDYIQLEGVVK